MALRAHAQMEPIPGYKLIERLGSGGFGEVWKAEAPGGLLKAIKFVHGTLQSATEDGSAVHQELRSLNRVKSVRHPYILSLERYDIIDGQLLIVMELADKNLADRFKECRNLGLPGISRDELLRYMEEAAEALDLMNIQYNLQHLDIKPQNLFLVHNHVKVADFGLVKDLEGINTQVTGGVTAIYAAPETFDGVISRYCDQYNLAIVYQELLTGQRPFSGSTVRQLMMQHLTAAPEVSSLPACDQPVITRALAKKPDDRFPSCTAMVQALRQAGLELSALRKNPRGTGAVMAAASVETPSPPAAPPISSVAPVTAPPPVIPMPAAVEPPRQISPMPAAAAAAPVAEPPPRPRRQESTGDGELQPALVIGIGGLGLRVIQQFRKGLHDRVGPPSAVPHIQLLYIETDPEVVREAYADDPEATLQEDEIILARLNKPAHYLRPMRGRPPIDAWLNTGILARIPRNQVTTDGLRLLGRLAFYDNYRHIVAKLKTDLTACGNLAALTTAQRQTHLGLRSSKPRVYVVTSLGGGTGSGMFIDLAYVVRRQMADLGVEQPEIIGVFLLPPVARNARRDPAVVNAFAALTELHHFSSTEGSYVATFEEGEEGFAETEPPFSRSIMLPLAEQGSEETAAADATVLAADFLCRDLVSPLGRVADEARAALPDEDAPREMTCLTFGAWSLAEPRRQLLQRVGRAICYRLVQGWLTADRAMVKAVKNRLADRCNNEELTVEGLIAHLQMACDRCLGEPAEAIFGRQVEEEFNPGSVPEKEHADRAIRAIEEIVGPPQEEGEENVVSTPMIEALDAAAHSLRKQWEKQLTHLVRGFLDDPRFRVAGAEEAASQIITTCEEVVEQQQTFLEDLYTRCGEAYDTIAELSDNLNKGSWWPGRKTRLADELRQALLLYGKLRYQCLILESLLEIYQSLLKKLPARFEEFRFARQRLEALAQELAVTPEAHSPTLRVGALFFPGDSQNLDEAVTEIMNSLTNDEMKKLGEQVQEAVRGQFQSLAALCMGSDETWQQFQAMLDQQAQSLVKDRLGTASVAERWLAGHEDEAELAQAIHNGLENAAPALPGRRFHGAELRLLIVPDDEAGGRLAELARQADDQLQMIHSPCHSEIYFFRERPQVPLVELPQLGLAAEEIYKQMTASGQFTPHSRTDIASWVPAT